MARTTGNLFDEIISYDNLYEAYVDARAKKRQHPEVAHFSALLDEHLINTHNHLSFGSWRTGKARTFRVFEPKQRDIQAPPFDDRVVHHALVRVIEPYFERRFIYHSYACRKGKGTLAAVLAVQKMMRAAYREWGPSYYVVKCDISQFFKSIDHQALLDELSKTISCSRTKKLWLTNLGGYGNIDGVGVPVGALTSQLGGNIMLNPLDHAITSGGGWGKYARYMDDFVVIVKDKAEAKKVFEFTEIEVSRLKLRLNPKSCYFPGSRGVDFAGYRIWGSHLLPRKRNLKRARERFRRLAKQYEQGLIGLQDIEPVIASFLGYVKHCRAGLSTEGILNEFILRRGSRHED